MSFFNKLLRMLGFGPRPAPKAHLDPMLGDTKALDLRKCLEERDWRPVQKSLQETADPDEREFLVEVLRTHSGRPDWLEQWSKQMPTSPIPWLMRGAHSIWWAWEARGSGTADTVAQNAWPVFYGRLRQAEDELHKALELDPEDHIPWSYLIVSARGLQLDMEEEVRRFEEARARHPLSREAHGNLLQNLCKKWGGSHKLMFDFARKTSEFSPNGHGLHAIIPAAHVERWLYYLDWENDEVSANSYFQRPAVEKEIFQAWSRSFGSPSFRPVTTTPTDRNMFAFCFWLMGDREAARQEFEALGPFVSKFPWCYWDKPVKAFKLARRDCGFRG